MPQLDPNWFLSQLFWLCICFSALYFVVSKFLAPRIKDIIQKRQDKIDDYINQAQQFNKEAQDVLTSYQTALKKAQDKTQSLIHQQQKDVENLIQTKHLQAEQSIQEELKKTEASVLKAKEDALKQADKISQELSQTILKKLDI